MAADISRNKKLGMFRDITEAQAAEKLLRTGCKITQLSAALQCSSKKAREIVKVLRRLGCEISEPPAGIREEHVYEMTGKSKLFSRYK